MPSAKRSKASAKRPVTPAKRPSRFRFIPDTIAEMRKVTWLTRREAAYLTGLVLLVTISVGIILGLIDLGFSNLISKLLLGG
jgi:preprotein translocase SecE subunit